MRDTETIELLLEELYKQKTVISALEARIDSLEEFVRLSDSPVYSHRSVVYRRLRTENRRLK